MNLSRRFTNQSDLAATIYELITYKSLNSHRFLIFVMDSTSLWLEELAAVSSAEYIDHQASTDRSDRINSILGSERSAAIIQLSENPDLGLLAATAGTIKAGGYLVVGVNPAIQNFSLRRLVRLVDQLAREHPNHILQVHAVAASTTAHRKDQTSAKEPGAATGNPRLTDKALPQHLASVKKTLPPFTQDITEAVNRHSRKNLEQASAKNRINATALAEQDALLEHAIVHITSNSNSCAAITGRRGRGKSSLLARIAQHFDSDGNSVAITAQNRLALSSWLRIAPETLRLFIAPEKAMTQKGQLLFIDEAANLPIASIQQYLKNYRHVVLGTTVEGYESGGRALEVRMLAEQSRSNRGYVKLEPCEPWRWASDDPVETFISRLLLHQESTKATIERDDFIATNYHCRRIQQQELAENEDLLASVYSLLHSTHYQTSTKDLEHLLDAPTIQLYAQLPVSNKSQEVVAVLLMEIEGQIENNHEDGINSHLHEAIVSKARRLPNQLLPQLLAQSANTPSALNKRYGRVLRIAVLPQLRRLQLATTLLNYVSTNTALDAIGASFASDEISQAFWQANAYRYFHKGYRTNPRTGKRAVAVLRSFEPLSQAVLEIAAAIHEDNERSDQGLFETTPDIDENALLQRFASGQRSLHDTRATLRRLCRLKNLPLERSTSQSRKQHELILRALVERIIRDQ